jgi:ribosomal protein L16 Arg81 hydroxylase
MKKAYSSADYWRLDMSEEKINREQVKITDWPDQEEATKGRFESRITKFRKEESPQFLAVDRRSALSLREFKREYLYPRKPVVITDAIEDWRARSSWTFDYFRSRYGGTPVVVYRYHEEDEFTPDAVEHISLAEYIDRITSMDWHSYPCYLRDNWKLFYAHRDLMTDHHVPKYFFDWFKLLPAFMRLPYPRIFIGPKGAITPLHVDVWGTHAWLSQLVGRKQWILFSPDQRHLLHDYKVRVEKPDLERFPLFRQTKPVECTIGPGDTIFVPSGWAHWVVSLESGISLTYNYMGPGCFASCLSNALQTLSLQRLRTALLRRVPK